jgi:RNA polymerase sigma-70 factor (ECF subfamily)
MPLDPETVMRLLLDERVKLLAFVRAIVRDQHVAEDVFQNVSVAAIKKCAQIESHEHFVAWIRQAARYESLHELRRRDSAPVVLDINLLDLLEGSWAEIEDQNAADQAEALRKCLSSLSPYARKLITLRYSNGKSGQKLADALGRNLNTVYVALSRTHRALAECIRRRLSDDEPSSDLEK